MDITSFPSDLRTSMQHYYDLDTSLKKNVLLFRAIFYLKRGLWCKLYIAKRLIFIVPWFYLRGGIHLFLLPLLLLFLLKLTQGQASRLTILKGVFVK